MARRLGMVVTAVVAATTVVLVPTGVGPAGADPGPASTSCTVGGVTWTVNYTSWPDSGLGPLVKVETMTRTDALGPADAAGMIWEWRLEIRSGDFYGGIFEGLTPSFRHGRGPKQPASAATPGPNDYWGPGDEDWYGVEWMTSLFSPRVVTPDGACVLYLAPFANRYGTPTWPRLAVLGDSLTQQLRSPTHTQTYLQGFVEDHFNNQLDLLAEVEGQGGRRWTMGHTDGNGNPLDDLAEADTYLLDDFRGLAQHDPDGFVIELGTNDALSILIEPIPATPDPFDYQPRPAAQVPAVRAAVHDEWQDIVLDQMLPATDCLVIVTAPEHSNHHVAGQAAETTAMNNLARWFDAQPGLYPDLHVVDFALEAKNFPWDPDVGEEGEWFLDDNVHLNAAGKLVLTAMIGQAAQVCT